MTMRRRTFAQLTASTGLLGLAGRALAQERASGRAPRAGVPHMGTNLSGMEWAKPGLRRNTSSLPNLHFTVPRRAEIAWLAGQGFTRNRLPIQWELLQPVLHDTQPNDAARALLGEPGAFDERYAQFVTDVLDAHAAAGTTCILDLHNYCRYADFVWQPDGSVRGLKPGPTPLHRPYTEDRSQAQVRIFALARGATLTREHFADFWVRAARRWKDHPGFGGYGLMNEPHDMPRPGETVASEGGEDLTIWPAYAKAAVEAIRRVDAEGPIYVAGNQWSSAMAMATKNPGFPLQGSNLIYEVHMYLDASSNGHAFDFDHEVGKNFSAGQGRKPIQLDTGVERLRGALDWARERKLRLALTEIGMPIDDKRWEAMFGRAVEAAVADGCEVYSWMGGSHWPIRNYPINHVPGWYQHRTLEPAVAGPMKAAAGIAGAALYDEAPGMAAPGKPVTVTVQARGFLPKALTLEVRLDAGTGPGATTVTIPAGANGSGSFSFTPISGRVTTVSYRAPEGITPPPPRKVYALADPVAHAEDDLEDAAHAVLARWSASKWEMAHGHTDYVLGSPSADGQPVRAVSDTGFGSTTANAMEMVNFLNTDNRESGAMRPPVMRTVRGRKALDLTARDTFGLWCKKTAPKAGVQPRPLNRMPFDLQDEHFALAVVSIPEGGRSGLVFQASQAEEAHAVELALHEGRPRARWRDARGQEVVLTGDQRLPVNAPAVLTLASGPGGQWLRLNGQLVGEAHARFAPSTLAQMLIGWGFVNYWPRDGFRGHLWGAIAGRGRPSEAELEVLERYLAGLAQAPGGGRRRGPER